jgi:hypothetical protein
MENSHQDNNRDSGIDLIGMVITGNGRPRRMEWKRIDVHNSTTVEEMVNSMVELIPSNILVEGICFQVRVVASGTSISQVTLYNREKEGMSVEYKIVTWIENAEGTEKATVEKLEIEQGFIFDMSKLKDVGQDEKEEIVRKFVKGTVIISVRSVMVLVTGKELVSKIIS